MSELERLWRELHQVCGYEGVSYYVNWSESENIFYVQTDGMSKSDYRETKSRDLEYAITAMLKKWGYDKTEDQG